jgi:hypothetical protein
MGKMGILFLAGGALLGSALAAVGIYLHESGALTGPESLECFLVSLLMIGLPLEWVCWKKAKFELVTSPVPK